MHACHMAGCRCTCTAAYCTSILFNKDSGVLHFLKDSAGLDEVIKEELWLLNKFMTEQLSLMFFITVCRLSGAAVDSPGELCQGSQEGGPAICSGDKGELGWLLLGPACKCLLLQEASNALFTKSKSSKVQCGVIVLLIIVSSSNNNGDRF